MTKLIKLALVLGLLSFAIHAQTIKPLGKNSEPMSAIQKVKITGTVVAYTIGLELANKQCRQTLIVNIKERKKIAQANGYFIIRYENTTCTKVFPEQLLKPGPRWQFSLIRSVDCDQLLEDLKYIPNPDETGVTSIPFLKFVPKASVEEIPTDRKLPCYTLNLDENELPVRRRVAKGVVVQSDKRPALGSQVHLKYFGVVSNLTVDTDKQGYFEIPVFQGVDCTVQASFVVNGQISFSKTIRIPKKGEIKPLQLIVTTPSNKKPK